MTTNELIEKLKAKEILFADVLAHIEANYNYTPSAFVNGQQKNAATENQGSAKVLYFAKLAELSDADTLVLFAEHYDAVLATPEENNHQNIRQFIQSGQAGVHFDGVVLTAK